MQRREFLQILASMPMVLNPQLARAVENKSTFNNKNTLVLVELKGGNDGLNTLIPYADQLYYTNRKVTGIARKDMLPLNDHVGLHPSLQPLMAAWDDGDMAWVQGVGYKNPNRSHFRSIEVWDTGRLDDESDDEGWVIRSLVNKKLKGVVIGDRLGPLTSPDLSSIGLINPMEYAKQGRKLAKIDPVSGNSALQHVLKVQSSVNSLSDDFYTHLSEIAPEHSKFPKKPIGRSLKAVYQMMVSGIEVPTYKVSIGGFDTHTNQLPQHQKLLRQLADSLAIFRSNLKSAGLWDSTLIMTYSEFGRRLLENANAGTDHGTAAPHLILGGKVHGGLYSKYPDLEKLDRRGDLIYTTDFRDVYSTVVKGWWGLETEFVHKPLPFI